MNVLRVKYLRRWNLMTEKKETYRCNVCGNVVEAKGGGEEKEEELTCCGEPMVKVEEEPKRGGGCCRK